PPAAAYCHGDESLPPVDDVAAYYRERNLAAVMFTVDFELERGRPPISNEEILDAARANPDVLIPFASVDPARPDAVERARAAIEGRARGLKLHPNLHEFRPTQPSA